jgi:CRISPR-associated protein Csx17
VELSGLTPSPLAHYLAALAVLRLVSGQADPQARGFWRADRFVLCSRLDREALLDFFLRSYAPSPILAPWNGGSGFYPSTTSEGLTQISASSAERWRPYREAIAQAWALVKKHGTEKRPDAGDEKTRLLQECRATFPEEALPWLDAAFVLTEENPAYPPLLGTGGNDGRLDFTNNHMKNLTSLLTPEGDPAPGARDALEALLFGQARPVEGKNSVGQFSPGAIGGPNAVAGFEADASLNPWAFVLMMEGSLWFAAAATRRMGSSGQSGLSSPFTVRATAAGYGSASGSDAKDARGELWMPLWERPAAYLELQHLLAEGRARVGHRPAKQAVDFAVALNTLGVDRGLRSFVRYGLHKRNGKAFLATQLGRFYTGANPEAAHLAEIDDWLRRLRRRASGDQTPARVKRSLRRIEQAILVFCQHNTPQSAQEIICALGQCAQDLSTSQKWLQQGQSKCYLGPAPTLSRRWLSAMMDHTPELRLAAALASQRFADGLRLRTFMEPLEHTPRGWRWAQNPSADVVWQPGRPMQSLRAITQRLMLHVQQKSATWTSQGPMVAPLDDVVALAQGRLQEHRLASLLQGLVLLRWDEHTPLPRSQPRRSPRHVAVPAALGLLKLCFAGQGVRGAQVPLTPQLYHLVRTGQLGLATQRASQRLRACGLVPSVQRVDGKPQEAQRLAATLIFPLGQAALEEVAARVLRPATNN